MTEIVYKCPTCGKEAKSKSALTLHIRKEHADDSLSELLAKYGDMAPRPGGAWKIDRPLTAAPSGVPSIDYAIGIGGVPRGTIIEIFGPSDCLDGNTTVKISVRREGQTIGRTRKKEVTLRDLYRRWHGRPHKPIPEGKCACGCGEDKHGVGRFIQFHASRTESFRNKDHVYTRSLIDGEIRLQRVRDVIFAGEKSVVILKLKSGRQLTCTADHRIMTEFGEWCGAGDLKKGDRVLVNGVRVRNPKGYVYLHGDEYSDHPRAHLQKVLAVAEHVLVAEQKLGRPLKADEVPHHIDENPSNNDPDNIEVVTRSEHNRLHNVRQNWDGGRDGSLVVLPTTDEVVSVTDAGVVDTFDLEMEEEPNFVANGIVVHNSGKTFTALTFSAFAQANGGVAGYVDAEHRLQPTFARLVPGLDLDTLYYCEPKGGEAALNMTKDFVSTGIYDVWTVDSVHACTPEALMNKPIGDNTMAELAKLMSNGMQVLDVVVAETNTVLIFVNHVKEVPGQTYGKDWFKPGGTAMDYYPSVHLHVRPSALYSDADGRRIGHTVRVKVEKSKVAAPFATGEFDLFYRAGKIKKPKHPYDGLEVVPGIDLGSCWFSVCAEAELIRVSGGRYYDTESGESLGYRPDVIKILESDCELRRKANELVYGKYASQGKREPAGSSSGA